MTAQLRAPMFAAAPKPAAPEVFEHEDLAPVTPETQAHMRMQQCFAVRIANGGRVTSTFKRDADTREALELTLRAFAYRQWPPAMVLAGQKLERHGAMARTRLLDGRMMDDLSDDEKVADDLLERAGVPAAVQLRAVK